MREAPPLGVCPRPEVWDGAIQQPVVVVGLVQRDKVLDRVDEVAEQWELLRRRRATVGTAASVAEGKNRCASLKSSRTCTTSARVVASGARARVRAASRIVFRVPQNRRVN